ncbi:MAG: hypothetical protein ACOXZV_09345 [Bacteroidales bacterium]
MWVSTENLARALYTFRHILSPAQQNPDYATGGVVSTIAVEYLLRNR